MYDAATIGDSVRDFSPVPPTTETRTLSPGNVAVDVGAVSIQSLPGHPWKCDVLVDGVSQRRLRKLVLTLEVGEVPKLELTHLIIK